MPPRKERRVQAAAPAAAVQRQPTMQAAVMAINAWNRLNVALRTLPGSADRAYGLDR